MKKIVFINPARRKDVLWNVLKVPPLGLATLAALTPRGYKIKIVDECIDRINFNCDADLIVISAITKTAPRAYQIARIFKERGIPVIIGGIHPSMIPEEAQKFADTVVCGEAEGIWEEILRDYENGKLKKRYNGKISTLKANLFPRRDLLKKRYSLEVVQTSRGCPFNCEFCSVTRFNGGSYRYRPIEDVFKEVRRLKQKRIFFCDDNIVGNGTVAEDRAVQLFNSIKRLNKTWFGQTSINVANNKKVLKAASDSGCAGFLIGIESINEKTLKSMNKGANLKQGVKNYKKSIRKIQDYGITVNGTFVMGSDSDDKSIFKQTKNFILDSGLDRSQITIATPFPGTRFYERLYKENRILYNNYPDDWAKYDCTNVVFKPKNMSIEDLIFGVSYIYENTTSLKASSQRLINSLMNVKKIIGPMSSFVYNRRMNQSVKRLFTSKRVKSY